MCTVLWYLRFTCSGCFSSCLQSDLFGTKSANVESFCTRGTCARWNSIGNACTGGASVTGAYTGVVGLGGPYIKGAYVGSTSAGGVWIKIAGACTGDARIRSACIESTFARRACARRAWIGGAGVGSMYTGIAISAWDACIGSTGTRGAGGIGAVKDLEICSRWSQILALKQYSLTLETGIEASWVKQYSIKLDTEIVVS